MEKLRKLLALTLALFLVLQVLPAGWAAEPASDKVPETIDTTEPKAAIPDAGLSAEKKEPAPDAEKEPDPDGRKEEYGLGWVEEELPPANNWISDSRMAEPQADRALPAKYDSRDLGIITAVRDQGGYGTCWAHAALACVETYMIKNKIIDATTGKAATTDINLSENHLAWYTYTDAYDALGMLDGDSAWAIPNANEGVESYLDVGGNGWKSAYTLMRGEGPASETVNGLQYSQADPDGLGDSFAFNNNAATVTDMTCIPTSDRDGVKQLLVQYGAGTISYYHDSAYLNSSNGAYCFIQSAGPGDEDYLGTNHAVTLVGWDDNYSKDNFRRGHRPNGNGAWIVKGSYGADRGDHGYYYISYEDTACLNSYNYFFTAAEAGIYDSIYQYDGTPAVRYFPAGQSTVQVANVFTANGSESLEAVSIATYGQGISYTVDIYTDLKTSDPTSGLYVSSESGTFTYSGVHTVSIPAVALHSGVTYSVVFELSCPTADSDGDYFDILFDRSGSYDYWGCTHASRPNVSYYNRTGSWDQIENGASTFRIKAFTRDLDPEFREKTVTLKQGEYKEYQLKALCSDGRDLENLRVISGSVPPGMCCMFKPSMKLIFGTPEEAGTFIVRYAITYTDDSLAYCTVTFRVLSNTPVPSSEFMALPVTWEASRTLRIDFGGASVVDWAVSSGSIPPGMGLTVNGSSKPVLAGTPHKSGTYVFDLSLVMSSGETLEHRVRAVVYSPGSPLKQLRIDLGHGPFTMSRDDYNNYMKTTAAQLESEGRLRVSTISDGSVFFDLNGDSNWDMAALFRQTYYDFHPVTGGCFLCDFKYTLSDESLAALSDRSDYAKELYLIPVQKPIPSYTVDLNLGPKEITLEEYMGHLLWPLSVMERDGQIRVTTSGTTSRIDLDCDGNDDIILELSLTKVRISAADTNNMTAVTRKLTAAQAEELADTCSALSLRFLLPQPAVFYPLYVNRVQVNSRNRGDILGNGVFSFDGKTLYIHGSCSLTDGIYSELPNLYIYTSEDSVLTISGMGIELREDAMLWGLGKLTIKGSRVAVYLNEGNVRLRIYYTELHASGSWGIAGESRNERLIIDNANVIAHGDSGAICDIAGGISIVDAKLAEPVGGSIGATAVLNPNGSETADAVIYSIRHYNPFVDVKEGAFYYDAVLWAVNSDPQITTGTDDTHFSPKRDCTRAQVVTFLWRAAGCPEPVSTGCAFTDIKPGAYYYKAVLWAVENNITSGASATKFAPDKACTRGQAVTFLWRARGCPQPTQTSHPFTDVKPGAYYYNAMLWALEWEITNGLTTTTFGPDKTCNRGQVVTFLYRAFGPQG